MNRDPDNVIPFELLSERPAERAHTAQTLRTMIQRLIRFSTDIRVAAYERHHEHTTHKIFRDYPDCPLCVYGSMAARRIGDLHLHFMPISPIDDVEFALAAACGYLAEDCSTLGHLYIAPEHPRKDSFGQALAQAWAVIGEAHTMLRQNGSYHLVAGELVVQVIRLRDQDMSTIGWLKDIQADQNPIALRMAGGYLVVASDGHELNRSGVLAIFAHPDIYTMP